MALRTTESNQRPNPLNGYLTTREAATYLSMSYWHFMHLVEANRIHGLRVVDRWLFAPKDLDTYRRSTRSGEIAELARIALSSPDIPLTPRQTTICEALIAGARPAEIARQQSQSRQAVHAQLALIREKVQTYQALHPAPKPRANRRAALPPPPPLDLPNLPLME